MRHSGPDFHRDKLQPESRVPGENRDPVLEIVPDFRRDGVWMPPCQARGRLIKSGMTEQVSLWTGTNYLCGSMITFMESFASTTI